jgi:hypothetical protein
MANPLYLFRADGRLTQRVVHIRPWSVGVVDKIGSDPRSSCVGWAERLMAWATHATAPHAWTPDAGFSFVATL